ncbi:hypothetical protein N7539_000404 [Penicillium diatomitis]|uniref:Uncharacterized protein n=1 Tax=Penicillium diatomitis TaxID=2819901 RepID=A0A9W9XLP6_9EURO|nr:uncharacterized protein N7539_000404 [Penicillium diatomitis]KAJ5495288.1 hypothetical protein N7539_000404 [Penicillium diatomitis]
MTGSALSYDHASHEVATELDRAFLVNKRPESILFPAAGELQPLVCRTDVFVDHSRPDEIVSTIAP